MILHSQPLPEFVSICENLCHRCSWLIHSQYSETPDPPILPSLPLVFLSLVPCALPPFVSPQGAPGASCLSGYASITQNKPNSLNSKTSATGYTTKSYTNIPPRSTPKNKPKQTQSQACPDCQSHLHSAPIFSSRNATSDIRYTTSETRPNQTQSRDTPPRPLAEQYAIRDTKYKPGPSRHSLWRSRIKDSSVPRDPAGIP